MTRPSIDHSILSPSGRVSKRAREAAMKREAARLFPPGYWDRPEPTPEQIATEREAKRSQMLDYAKFLRHLADGGMRPRVHRREATRLEREAVEL